MQAQPTNLGKENKRKTVKEGLNFNWTRSVRSVFKVRVLWCLMNIHEFYSVSVFFFAGSKKSAVFVMYKCQCYCYCFVSECNDYEHA